MNSRLFSSLILFILLSTSVMANLRAPWQITPFPSFALVGGKALVVVAEDLEFDCPDLYKNEPDFDSLRKAACKVNATYRVVAKADTVVALEFIGPSTDLMTANVNGKSSEIVASGIPLTRKQAEAYGMYPICRFCASDEMQLKSGRFRAILKSGENTIHVTYVQQLALREVSYGYFQDSRWSQGFDYELWPLAEWEIAPDFRMNIRIRTPARGFFSRIFETDHPWECRAENFGGPSDRTVRFPFPNRNKPPIDPDDIKQTPIPLVKKSESVLEVTFGKNFPDRLSCSMQ
ncbi:MAG: hypothetical protein JNM27_16170 [Leptospirales bacterium]|nr:hypothetical protein [Leptospirales bacterium]